MSEEMHREKAPAPQRWGLPRLLWGLIVRPRVTLEYLRDREGRTWWIPVLLGLLLTALPIVVAGPATTRQDDHKLPGRAHDSAAFSRVFTNQSRVFFKPSAKGTNRFGPKTSWTRSVLACERVTVPFVGRM